MLAACGACDGLLGPRPSADPLWRVPLGEGDRNTEGVPAADAERLYALAGGVVAFAAADGALLWRNRLPGEEHRPRNVVVHGGRVFAAGMTAFALEAATGRELWRFPLPAGSTAALGRIAADDGAVYVGTDTHRVYALDAASGAARWTADVGPDWPHRGIVTGVTAAGDTVYVAVRQYNSENGHLSTGWIVALERATGRLLWSFRNGAGTDWRSVSAGPTVAGRLLLASDLLSGAVFALDRFTVREAWRFVGPADKFGPASSPVAVEGRAYAASSDNWVYALDVETGSVAWRTRNPGSHFSFAVCGRWVFANYMDLAILDRHSGAVLQRRAGAEIFSDFAVFGDRAYAISDQAVYAFSCP